MADLFGINIFEIAQHDNAGVIIWIASDRGREPVNSAGIHKCLSLKFLQNLPPKTVTIPVGYKHLVERFLGDKLPSRVRVSPREYPYRLLGESPLRCFQSQNRWWLDLPQVVALSQEWFSFSGGRMGSSSQNIVPHSLPMSGSKWSYHKVRRKDDELGRKLRIPVKTT